MSTLTEFLLERLAETRGAAEWAVRTQAAPSGWLGPLLDVLAAHQTVVDLASDYSPELEHGDNGEWAFDATLRALALPYVDHPDYRAEWKP